MEKGIAHLWDEVHNLRADRHDVNQRVQKLFSDFDGHLTLCTQRHAQIQVSLASILAILKWLGALVITTLLAMVAFLIKRSLFP